MHELPLLALPDLEEIVSESGKQSEPSQIQSRVSLAGGNLLAGMEQVFECIAAVYMDTTPLL